MAIFPRGETAEDPLHLLNSEINQQLQALVDHKQIHLLDINSTYLAGEQKINKELFPDLLHLSPAAYEIWADKLSKKLTELEIQ
jgi:lysophospholipase L1-like esterase